MFSPSSSMSSSSITPSSDALESARNFKDLAIFKTPVGPVKKKNVKVLKEEKYIEKLSEIIQRDFFPDLEKIKAQNEYIEALEQNDTKKMRELYEKYSLLRHHGTERLASPATFETPFKEEGAADEPLEPSTKVIDDAIIEKEQKAGLDVFLSKNTSEDNASFEGILSENEKKHRLKNSWLYKSETKSQTLSIQNNNCSLAIEYNVKKRPFELDTWTYKNKNHVMYVPDGVELTSDEKIDLAKKQQEIVHTNTRLKVNPFNEQQNKETVNELMKVQSKAKDGKIGIDGKEIVRTETPRIRGYTILATPSLVPQNVIDSPVMTWGIIEGTPFRLDGGDTPLLHASQGPSFRMSEQPKREKLALQLAEKAGERSRDKKLKALNAARQTLTTISPRNRHGSINNTTAIRSDSQESQAWRTSTHNQESRIHKRADLPVSKRMQNNEQFRMRQRQGIAHCMVEIVLATRGDISRLNSPRAQEAVKKMHPSLNVPSDNDYETELNQLVSQLKIHHNGENIVGIGVAAFNRPNIPYIGLLSFTITSEDDYSYVDNNRAPKNDHGDFLNYLIKTSIEIVRKEYHAAVSLILFHGDIDCPPVVNCDNDSIYFIVPDSNRSIEELNAMPEDALAPEYRREIKNFEHFLKNKNIPRLPEMADKLFNLITLNNFSASENPLTVPCHTFASEVCTGSHFLSPDLINDAARANVHYNEMKNEFYESIGWFANGGKILSAYGPRLARFRATHTTPLDKSARMAFLRQWTQDNPSDKIDLVKLVQFPACMKPHSTSQSVLEFVRVINKPMASRELQKKVMIFQDFFNECINL